MIKEVLQILIITFLLISSYDIIDIYLNHLNTPKERELLIVKREVDRPKKLLKKSTPFETFHFPFWPVAIGSSISFCFIVYRYFLPVKYVFFKTPSPVQILCENDKTKGSNNENNEEYICNEFMKGDDSIKPFNDCLSDITFRNEVVFSKNPMVMNKNSLQENEISLHKKATLINQKKKIVTEKVEQKKSILSFTIPSLLNTDILPLPSKINILNSDSLSSSTSGLLHMDCSNSKNLCDMLLENRNISKMEMHVKSRFVDEKTCLNSDKDPDDMSILSHSDKIMGMLSIYNNDNYSTNSVCDKDTNVQLLTYSDNDIANIEKRLEVIEHGLRRSEEKTEEWDHRMNVAEIELVDLHEQMYNIFTKLEEMKPGNYIMASKVSSESVESKKHQEDKDIFISEANAVAEKLTKFSSGKDGFENELNNFLEKYTAEAENYRNLNEVNLMKNESYIDLELGGIKKKSVALAAELDKYVGTELKNCTQKKTLLHVPPHILPPYKRSSFASTDSKADFIKTKRKFKVSKV